VLKKLRTGILHLVLDTGILVCVVMLTASPAMARKYSLAPIQLGGELSYTLRQADAMERDDRDEQLTRFRLTANSFIWQSWFARWQAGLTFGVNRSERDALAGTETTTSDVASGNLLFRFFPVSHFPLELFYDQNDSRVEDTRDFLSDIEFTRYGIAQRYNAANGNRYRLRLETNEIIDEEGAEDTGDLIRLGVSRSFNAHQVSFDYGLTQIDRDERVTRRTGIDDDSRDVAMTLRHSFRPGRQFNISNTLDFDEEDTEILEGVDIRFSSLQFNSFLTWQPNITRPLRITGSTRVSNFDRTSAGIDSDSELIDLSVGAIYDLNQYWQLTGSVGLDQSERGSDTARTTFESVGFRYRPDLITLGKFDYNWSLGSTVTNFDEEEEGNSQDLDFGIGHNLSRRFALEDQSSIVFRLSENARAQDDTSEDEFNSNSERVLVHGTSLTWNKSQGRTNLSAGISLNDSRDFGEDEDTFQLGNVRFSGYHQLGRHASLSGNLGYQITRRDDFGFDESGGSRRDKSSSVNLRYIHGRTFGVRRLRFKSEVTVRNSLLRSDADDDLRSLLLNDRQADREWENRLDYAIGRLDLTLSSTFSETEDDMERSMMFRVTRRFGR